MNRKSDGGEKKRRGAICVVVGAFLGLPESTTYPIAPVAGIVAIRFAHKVVHVVVTEEGKHREEKKRLIPKVRLRPTHDLSSVGSLVGWLWRG